MPCGGTPVFTHFDIPSYNSRVFSVVNTMPITHPLLHSTRITAHDSVIPFENALQHHTFTTQARTSAPSSQRPSSRIWISTLLACPSPGKVMAAPRCTHRPSCDKKILLYIDCGNVHKPKKRNWLAKPLKFHANSCELLVSLHCAGCWQFVLKPWW